MQNGIDCGAINVSVLLALISTGSVYDRRDYLVKLRMACAHDVWLQVLEVVVNHLSVIYKTYLLHQTSLGHHELVTDAIVNIFSQGIESYYNTYAIQRSLEDDRHGCGVCSRTVEREHEKDGISDSDYSGTSKKEMEEGWADDITFTWLHKLRKMFHALKNARQICKVVKSAQLAKGLTTVPLEDIPFELVPHNRFMDFNDYFHGPTLEEQQKFMQTWGVTLHSSTQVIGPLSEARGSGSMTGDIDCCQCFPICLQAANCKR